MPPQCSNRYRQDSILQTPREAQIELRPRRVAVEAEIDTAIKLQRAVIGGLPGGVQIKGILRGDTGGIAVLGRPGFRAQGDAILQRDQRRRGVMVRLRTELLDINHLAA